MDDLVESIIGFGLYPAVVILKEFERDEDYEGCAMMRDAIILACEESEIKPEIAFRDDAIEFLHDAIVNSYGIESALELPYRVEAFRRDIIKD